MASKSMHAVLDVPELVELILSHLPYHDLVSSRRTSKGFREIVNGSHLRERISFLDPCPVTSVVRWSGNAEPDFSFMNLFDHRDLPYVQERLRLAGQIIIVNTSISCPGDFVVVNMNPVFADVKWHSPVRGVDVAFDFDITNLDEFVAEDPKRAEMFLCQPPAAKVVLTVHPLPWDGSDETRPDVLDQDFDPLVAITGHAGGGVRLGDLQRHYRRLEEKRASRLDDECYLFMEGFISERSRWMAVARGEMDVDNLHRIRLGAGWL